MIEFSPATAAGAGEGDYKLGFAGDTFNTVVGLARLGVDTAYITLLGDDVFSDKILAMMGDEGVSATLVERVPGRQPGLYVIANAPNGERTFRYWRAESPARALWLDERAALRLEEGLASCSWIYLSGITLAIMQPLARNRLLQFLMDYRRRGGCLAFDSNFRARLWPDIEEARTVIGDFLRISDLALLTLEDEQALWGEVSAEEIIERHSRARIGELVIKRGAEPVLIREGGELSRVNVPVIDDIVDTTGAGDAFNAGYLAQRIGGGTTAEAAAWGNRSAAAVIRRRGGIVPRSDFLQEMAGR